MGIAPWTRRLLPTASALALIGFITFIFGDVNGNHRISGAGAVIFGAAVPMAVARWSLWRASLVADQLQGDEGARADRRESAVALLSERRLFIISPAHPELYERAVRTFGSTRGTQVIYDRRLGERRRGGPAPATKQRRRERRKRADVDAEITALGSAIVRLK